MSSSDSCIDLARRRFGQPAPGFGRANGKRHTGKTSTLERNLAFFTTTISTHSGYANRETLDVFVRRPRAL
jgi:hypothetical protein